MKTKNNIQNKIIKFLHKFAIWLIGGLIVFSFSLIVINICNCLISSEMIAYISSIFFIWLFIITYPLDDYYKLFGL